MLYSGKGWSTRVLCIGRVYCHSLDLCTLQPPLARAMAAVLQLEHRPGQAVHKSPGEKFGGTDRSAKGVWRIITALFSLYEVAGFSMPEMRGGLPWPWLLSLNVRGADDGVPHSSACTCP